MKELLLILAVTGQPDTQYLVFSAPWCAHCKTAEQDYRPWLEKSGWTFGGKTSHFWVVDGDQHPKSLVDWNIESYPTFVLVKDGVEVKRFVGYPGRKPLVDEYIKTCQLKY